MASLSGVNTNAEPQDDFSVLPAGEYKVVIAKEEVKASKSSPGSEYLNLQVKVIDGEYKNRTVFHILNLWNQNPKAKEIAERELASIRVAINLPVITDTAQLLNRPLVARLGIEQDATYGDKNKIKGWKPLTGNSPSAGGSKPSVTPPTSSGGSSAIRAHEDDMPEEMANF